MSASSARLGRDERPDPAANVDCDRIVEPGETVVVTDLKGPGVITHIWMTVYHFPSLQFGKEKRGRAYLDRQEHEALAGASRPVG